MLRPAFRHRPTWGDPDDSDRQRRQNHKDEQCQTEEDSQKTEVTHNISPLIKDTSPAQAFIACLRIAVIYLIGQGDATPAAGWPISTQAQAARRLLRAGD